MQRWISSLICYKVRAFIVRDMNASQETLFESLSWLGLLPFLWLWWHESIKEGLLVWSIKIGNERIREQISLVSILLSLRWRIDWLLSPSGQNFTWGRGSWADVILSDNWRLYRSHQPCYDKQCFKLNHGALVLRPIVSKTCLNNVLTLEICDNKVI